MNENLHPFYHHSGKFGVHGPLLAILAAIVVGYPLGIIYAYLIKWIPFIYLNFFIAVGYGLAFGFIAMPLLRFARVRNTPIALLTGLGTGLCAVYLSWNGYAHAMVTGAPVLLTPTQLGRFMKILYDNGSWSIGFGSNAPVTGVLLAIFWLAEAGIIVGGSMLLSFGAVAQIPFCETHECWLNEEKKIDKLDAFILPDHIAALKAGSIEPLEHAVPRVPAAGRFSRLTLRHSAKCEEFCTLSIENVTVTLDKNGKSRETTQPVIANLLLPKTMLDYLEKFEHATAKAVPSV